MKNKRPPEAPMIHRGELATRRTFLRRGALFLAPGLGWIVVFLFIPLVALLVVSFAERGSHGGVVWQFSFLNLRRLAGYSFFGWSNDNLIILLRSLRIGVVTTVWCIALAYPLAFFLASRPPRTRNLWLTTLLVPFWTNLVIRTYAWQLVFGSGTPLSRFAIQLGFIPPGGGLFPSPFAVYVGMIATFLPFVTLPVYAAVEKLDWSLIDAVSDLYGGPVRTFYHGILFQTLPGLQVGVTLTLVPAMGMFVVPDLLGGARYMLVGNLIQQQITTSNDLPYGAMISLALVLMTLVLLWFTHSRGLDKHSGGRT